MPTDPQAHTQFKAQQITVDGVTATVEEHAAKRGLQIKTVYDRRRRGCSWADAMRENVRKSSNSFLLDKRKPKPKNPEPEPKPVVAEPDSVDRPKRTRFA